MLSRCHTRNKSARRKVCHPLLRSLGELAWTASVNFEPRAFLRAVFDAKLLFPQNYDVRFELTLPVFFTPEQAREFLPEVRQTVHRIIAIKKEADSETDDDAIAGAMGRLEKEIQKLEELGCILKDMNSGLIDFPAVRLGTRVWLCWKLGEDDVTFWYELHEGYAGRKLVDEKEFYPDDVAIKSLTGEAVTKPHS